MKRIVLWLLAVVLLSFLSVADGECYQSSIVSYSEEQMITDAPIGEPVGDWNAKTFIKFRCDMPEAIGWEFSRSFFNQSQNFETMHMFPDTPSNHPFKGIFVHFTTQGHAPLPFRVAHFDLHFLTSTIEEQLEIVPGHCGTQTSEVPCEVAEKGLRFPDKDYLPPHYMSSLQTIPYQGTHWLDPLSILRTFDMVFVYGTYDRTVRFWEPMITMEYIEKGAHECRTIDLPRLYAVESYYPTKYCVRQFEDKFQVTLESFVYREFSE